MSRNSLYVSEELEADLNQKMFPNYFTSTSKIYLHTSEMPTPDVLVTSNLVPGWALVSENLGTVTNNTIPTYKTTTLNPDITLPNIGDAYAENVGILMNFEGDDGSTNFVENTGKTISSINNVTMETEQKKFGNSSAYFAGTDSSSFVIDNAPTLSDKFTLEMWIYPTGAPGQNNGIFDNRNGVNNPNGFILGYSNTGALWCKYHGAYDDLPVNQAYVTYNEWQHIALVRDGNNLSMFKNGVKVLENTNFTRTFNNNYGLVGRAVDLSYGFQGYMDDLRVTNNVARYTTDFSVPTEEFSTSVNTLQDSYWGKVEMLVKASEGFNELANGYTVNNNGVTIDNTTTLFDGASFNIDSGTDKLNVTVPSTFYDYSSSDFTWEGFYYINSIQNGGLMGYRSSAGNNLQLNLGFPSSNTLALLLNDSALVSTTYLTEWLNTWKHIAVTKEGTTYRLFVDGVKYDEQVNTTVINKTATYCNLSTRLDFNSRVTYGYGDQYRITKGVARYTSNFTVPTEAFPTDSSSSNTLQDTVIKWFEIESNGNSLFGEVGDVNDKKNNIHKEITIEEKDLSKNPTPSVIDMAIKFRIMGVQT